MSEEEIRFFQQKIHSQESRKDYKIVLAFLRIEGKFLFDKLLNLVSISNFASLILGKIVENKLRREFSEQLSFSL